MSTASKTSRISSASSGWRSQYSLMVGFSPRLQRARNSSASTSTGLRTSLEEDIALLPVLVKKARCGLQNITQAFQGADMPIASGRRLDAEHLGGLVIGEFLEMPQGQDFPVDRIEIVDGLLEVQLHLGALHGLGHRREPAKQLGGEGDTGGLRHGAAMQRHFAAGVAHLRAQMLSVDQLQPLSGEEAQPQEERHVGFLGVFGRPSLEVEKRFLEDVGRVGPPLQAAIQAQPHDAAQPVAVTFPDPPEHLRIRTALADHLDRVFIIAQAHGRVTTPGNDWNTREMVYSQISRRRVTTITLGHLTSRGYNLGNRLSAAPRRKNEPLGTFC